MMRKVITRIRYPLLIVGIVLSLLGAQGRPFGFAQDRPFDGAQDRLRSGQALRSFGFAQDRLRSGQAQAATGNMAQTAMGNIDPVNKWAWSTNAGWINFGPTHGRMTVYDDHLEGYAWAENIGWIRLGSYTGGGTHHYDNTASTNYGVNRDGSNLSGYAWSTNVGWINFNPTHSQVTIDPATGGFDGYAWSENVGWIHFKDYGGGDNVYLPLISKGIVSAPDLVVESLTATSNAVTVVIKNQGNAAVSDAFWVDVYFNPSVTPGFNQEWHTIASHGVVWGITTNVPAGDSLTLTTGGDYYFPEHSSTPPLPVGADVYVLVDSVDHSTTYGAVPESNESNNLFGPVASTATTGQAAVANQGRFVSKGGLPPR